MNTEPDIHVPHLRVTCPKCEGCGLIPLPAVFWATVQIVRNHPDGCSTEDVVRAYSRPVKFTAIYNQLRKLEGWGIVTSWKESTRSLIWKIAQKEAQP